MEGVTIITMGVGFGPSNGHVDVRNALFIYFVHVSDTHFVCWGKIWTSSTSGFKLLDKVCAAWSDWSPTISVSCCFFQALNDLNNEDLKAKLGLEDLSEGWEWKTCGGSVDARKILTEYLVARSSACEWLILATTTDSSSHFLSEPVFLVVAQQTDLHANFQDLPTVMINFAHGKDKRSTLFNPFKMLRNMLVISWWMFLICFEHVERVLPFDLCPSEPPWPRKASSSAGGIWNSLGGAGSLSAACESLLCFGMVVYGCFQK